MMAQSEFFAELDRRNAEKTSEILSGLPMMVTDYFRSRKANTTARTRLSYAYDLRLFFDWLVSIRKLNDRQEASSVNVEDLRTLTARDIETFLEYLETDKDRANSKYGMARKYACLSSFFDYLCRNDWLPANPCSKVIPVKPDRDERIIRLAPEEVVRFLDAIEYTQGMFTEKQKKFLARTAVRDLAIAAMLLGTGIRVSELVGLNLSNIYLDKCQVSVYGKGGKYRTVPLGDETIDMLMPYLEQRKTITPSLPEDADAVFLSSQRRRMCIQAVEDMISKYASAIGVQDRITPHKLRKTYGTELYEETGDIFLVAQSLGHNNVNTTRNHYVASDEEKLLAARNKVKLRK